MVHPRYSNIFRTAAPLFHAIVETGAIQHGTKNYGARTYNSTMPRILYIEDNRDNRTLVRRVLLAEGFEVVEAGSAQEGFELAEAEPPDLILMDINMPTLDGLTATGHIRQNSVLQHIPVVALTANVMRGDREKALDAGCDGYIQKPIDVDRFPGEILRFIRQFGRPG